jgi:hypothetical protein
MNLAVFSEVLQPLRREDGVIEGATAADVIITPNENQSFFPGDRTSWSAAYRRGIQP